MFWQRSARAVTAIFTTVFCHVELFRVTDFRLVWCLLLSWGQDSSLLPGANYDFEFGGSVRAIRAQDDSTSLRGKRGGTKPRPSCPEGAVVISLERGGEACELPWLPFCSLIKACWHLKTNGINWITVLDRKMAFSVLVIWENQAPKSLSLKVLLTCPIFLYVFP